MSRIKRARPSPAILIAVAALVAALGGSAVAGVATTSLSKGDTKKVKKLAKKQAKKFDKKQDKKNFPVDSSQIGDGAVAQAKLADGAVGTGKLSGSIPAARVSNTVDQEIADGTTTPLAFDQERYDTASLHSNSTNNTRLVAPVSGVYAVWAGISMDGDATGRRFLQFRRSGGPIIGSDVMLTPSASGLNQTTSTIAALAAGDYVEAQVFQDSGGPLDVLADSERSPEFSMTWLAPGP